MGTITTMPPRRKAKRPIAGPGAGTISPATLTVAVQRAMGEQREAIRRGQTDYLGRMLLAETPHGIIRFPGSTGPHLAAVLEKEGQRTGALAILSEWEGLPSYRRNTTERCQSCLVPCDVCQEKGKKLCEAYGCGGAGKIALPRVPCDCDGCLKATGRFNPDCKKCGGTGELTLYAECAVCNGTGQMKCPVCQGSGKRTSGVKADRVCENCQGSMFEGETVEQRVENFVNAWLVGKKTEGTTGLVAVLGPITMMVVDRDNRRESWPVEADEHGDLLVLLLQQDADSVKPYLMGGKVRGLK